MCDYVGILVFVGDYISTLFSPHSSILYKTTLLSYVLYKTTLMSYRRLVLCLIEDLTMLICLYNYIPPGRAVCCRYFYCTHPDTKKARYKKDYNWGQITIKPIKSNQLI